MKKFLFGLIAGLATVAVVSFAVTEPWVTSAGTFIVTPILRLSGTDYDVSAVTVTNAKNVTASVINAATLSTTLGSAATLTVTYGTFYASTSNGGTCDTLIHIPTNIVISAVAPLTAVTINTGTISAVTNATGVVTTVNKLTAH